MFVNHLAAGFELTPTVAKLYVAAAVGLVSRGAARQARDLEKANAWWGLRHPGFLQDAGKTHLAAGVEGQPMLHLAPRRGNELFA